VIIKSIKLENYRRFRSIEIELPENLIGIVGSNGVGKTTLVEAIGWVLYGNKIRRSDKQDVRSQFSENSDVCSVEMLFTAGGHEYRVIRKLKGKNAITEAAIYRDGNLDPEAVQEKGVNEFVENLINLDNKSFFASVFARQKELAALSVLQPEERRKSIARLIDIDQIDRARIQVRSTRNSHEGLKKGILIQLKDKEELKERKSELSESYKAKQGELKDIKTRYSEQQVSIEELSKEYDRLSELRDKYNQLNSELTNLRSRHKDFSENREQYVSRLEDLNAVEKQLIELKESIQPYEEIKKKKIKLDDESVKFADLQRLRDKELHFTRLIDSKRKEMKEEYEKVIAMGDMDEKRKEIETRLQDVEKSFERNEKKLVSVISQQEKVREKGLEIKERREKVGQLGPESPCPVCSRPLGEHYDEVVEKFENDIWDLRARFKELGHQAESHQVISKELKEKMKAIKIERDKILGEHEAFKLRVENNEKMGLEIHNYVDEQQAVREQIKKLGTIRYDKKEHERINAEYDRLSALRERVLKHEESIKQKEQLEADLSRITTTLVSLDKNIASSQKTLDDLNFENKYFSDAKEKLNKSQINLEESRKKLETMNQELIRIEKDIEKVNEELKFRKDMLKKVKKIDEDISYLNALDYHFGIFRQELAGRIRPIISHRASELLNLTTNGNYSLLELDEDYNIYIFDQSDKFPINRFSGGEQDLANLCLRIAISQVVAERAGGKQVNFIVLDEIFGSQDEERKELIMRMLQHLSSQFRQIFVITHVEDIKDIMPVVLSVERKNEKESTARLL